MRIAHITDLHFQRLDRASWRDLIGKRAIGAFNLRVLGRDKQFDEGVARCAVRSIAELKPDFLAITGDLSALALDSEFDAALAALKPLLDSIPSLIIAGNHDVYTGDARARFEAKFAPWMGRRYESGLQAKSCEDVLFIGVDCCRPTLIGSRGRVRYSQIHHLNQILCRPMVEHRVVLLTHYPVVDRDGNAYHMTHTWHGIENGADLLAVLARAARKPSMIIHGHAHRGFSSVFAGIPVHNPGSGACAFAAGARRSAFNVYDLGDGGSNEPVTTRYVHDGFEFVPDADNDTVSVLSSGIGTSYATSSCHSNSSK